MRRCVLAHITTLRLFEADNLHSDGRTPDEIIKQILSIAPILPGQGNDALKKSSQPFLSSGNSSQHQQQQQQYSQPQQRRQQQQQGNQDLVDFGQNDVSTSGGQQSQRSVSGQAPALMGGGGGGRLQEPLMPHVTRQDSIEGGQEVFVDAES